MKFFGFRGGVHPPENKLQTENMKTERLASPSELYVPLIAIKNDDLFIIISDI